MGLPGDAEIRSYHGLMKKFRQSREGDIFGEVCEGSAARVEGEDPCFQEVPLLAFGLLACTCMITCMQ